MPSFMVSHLSQREQTVYMGVCGLVPISTDLNQRVLCFTLVLRQMSFSDSDESARSTIKEWRVLVAPRDIYPYLPHSEQTKTLA